MKKTTTLAALALLAVTALLAVGCGGDDAETVTCSICMEEIPADQAKTVDGAIMCAGCAGMGGEAVAEETHDCDGPCPMTDVPVSQLTVVDGKYYCKGCLAKLNLEEAAAGAVDAAGELAGEAEGAVEGAVDEAQEAVEGAVDDAEEAAGEAVDDLKNKIGG